jgi:preprotein translocase subunit SecF
VQSPLSKSRHVHLLVNILFRLFLLNIFSTKFSIVLLATQTKTAQIDSHTVVSSGTSLKGTMVVSQCDKQSLQQSKETLGNALTKQVQAESTNSNSKIQINDVTQSSDGTLTLTYECTGAQNHESAKNALNNAVKQDDVKKVIGQSSQKDASTTTKQQITTQTCELS